LARDPRIYGGDTDTGGREAGKSGKNGNLKQSERNAKRIEWRAGKIINLRLVDRKAETGQKADTRGSPHSQAYLSEKKDWVKKKN